MFKIGNLEIENNVCLAPMAGVCNSAFRRIVKEYGAGLLYMHFLFLYHHHLQFDDLFLT